MDILFKSLELEPRRFDSGLRAEYIGYRPDKKDWIDCPFESFNFSLILEGRGQFESPDLVTKVEAPCVITQGPGTQQAYGPDENGWTEVFLIYNKDRQAALEARGFWPPAAPMWKVQCADLFNETARSLVRRMQLDPSIEQADYLDRLMEQCILTSLMQAPEAPHSDPLDARLLEIRSMLEADLSQVANWEVLAANSDMSLSTFRRHWLRLLGAPPANYLARKRMESAARLLMVTRLSIHEIAGKVGFEDALHFSRVFKKHYGTSPRAYRHERRIV
ncbi:helix-turn-helix domain-containing protein [Coraliomargarita akajimensis]|uniref:Transcriptional regulator, AraC family n=1 Tax=Coraliomargarita akajimensis (strain DSM 45221 / IAM 15411 / JCM 23193 / KCTC 12865 / 04OKA010-24) TaxID=583355 RepID=D5EQ66_CORAD|nr:AraC family transcriptional regulator [Coraliomargarita akajimensis]ADE53834.1 transcriptional regulator, AraC family [Coraliomargarita akajimensis DSM 45221]